MSTLSRVSRLSVLAVALTMSLAACGGTSGPPSTDAAGLPSADDLGVADGEQDLDPVEEPGTGEAPATAGMCAADQPDCQDTIPADGGADAADSGAAGSCLAGDPDCTDESYGGQDVARAVPLSGEPSGAELARRGATTGATGHLVEHAHLLDGDTLQLTVGDNPCMLVQDVLVEESDEEVRVLVLAGQDAATDACIESYVQFTVEVELGAPLGGRTLLDLAG